MKKKIVLTLLCIILVVFFVFGLVLGSFDFTRSKIIEKTDYYLVDGCPPGTRYWGLYHRDRLEGVVGGCIKDIYWNEQYILVKTHYGANSDSIEGYYIVKLLPPVKKGVSWEKIGPLSKEEYGQKKLELHLNEEKMKHKSLFKGESK